MRTVYLRLRWLADAGCVFLGHGLDNDFRMCNLTLPPAQVAELIQLASDLEWTAAALCCCFSEFTPSPRPGS